MLRFGILSTASIAPRYIKGIREVEDATVLAVASRNIDKAKIFAQENNIERAYGSYEELLDDRDVDIVYLPLMNSIHYEWTRKAILKDKHVVVEKPFVLHKSQAIELFELAKENNVFLMEAQKAVFLPTTIRAKQLIEEGRIGEVKYIETRQGSKNRFDDDHWMNSLKMGGGALYGSIAYPTEMIQYIFDAKDFKYNASFVDGRGDVDGIVNFHLLFADKLLSATISMECETQNEAVFYGTKGKIVIPDFWKANKIFIYDENGKSYEEYPVPSEFKYQVEHIKQCLDKRLLNSPIMTPERTIEMVGIMEELYKNYHHKG